jgi:serine/threonine-protein kinase
MVPPLPLGSLLRQRYLIQEILGQGGFGRTYLAIDQERFDERCVLKEFLVPYEEEGLVQKSQVLFQREASTLYQIQHPQIPRFWAAFEDSQRLFLVQDFVEGQTYRQLLNQRRQFNEFESPNGGAHFRQPFSEAEIRHLFRQLLPVLTYIHDRGIIHRDISPDNIILKVEPPKFESAKSGPIPVTANPTGARWLAELGLPVLIDFGAVKEATAYRALTTAITTRVGKVGYAPPEQLQTGQVYPNSDLYSLATTGLALLTGKEPRMLLESQTLDWCWQPYANVSHEMAAILKRMLSVYPSDRYQSAGEVLAELEAQSDLGQQPTELQASRAQELEPPSDYQSRMVSHANFLPPPDLGVPNVSHLPMDSNIPPLAPQRSQAMGQPKASRNAFGSNSVSEQQKRTRIGVAIAFLLGSGIAGTFLWQAFTEPSDRNGEVWISGTRVPQTEASRIIGIPGNSSANSAVQGASGMASNGDRDGFADRGTGPLQVIAFPPDKFSTLLQGNLQEHNLQPYVLKATQGQILTATLEGSGVVMNLLRSNQEGIDPAAYQTRSWTGQLPIDDSYLIHVSGSGSYTLDIAITPPSRPSQERTERVVFAKGTNGTTVTGNIAPNHIRRYLLKAKQGQIVLVKVLQGRVRLSAIAPNGQRIGGNTATTKDWKGRITMDGDYVIELSTDQTGDYALGFEIF